MPRQGSFDPQLAAWRVSLVIAPLQHNASERTCEPCPELDGKAQDTRVDECRRKAMVLLHTVPMPIGPRKKPAASLIGLIYHDVTGPWLR